MSEVRDMSKKGARSMNNLAQVKQYFTQLKHREEDEVRFKRRRPR